MRRFLPALLAMALPAFIAGTAAAQITLLPGPQFPLSLAPTFIAASDYNNDGIADAILSSTQSARVSVAFGSQTGSFSAVVDFAIGRSPRGIAGGDLNSDNNSDVAVADLSLSRILVNNGDGTGNFGIPRSFIVGFRSVDVAICNFDKKNGNDMVSANQSSNDLTPLFNIGGGRGFMSAGNIAVGRAPKRVKCADLNGDGFDEILALNTGQVSADNVSVLLNTGVSTFKQPPANYVVGVGAVDLVVKDFNNDGAPDIAVLNAGITAGQANTFSVSILINRTVLSNGKQVGTGQFDLETPITLTCPANIGGIPISCTPAFIASGDFDNDGNNDIAVSFITASSGQAHITTPGLITAFAGHGDGSFDFATQVNVGFRPQGIVAADFTGDGVADIGLAEQGTRSVRIIRSLAPAPFQNGTSCNIASQCASTFCVDKTCCSTSSCPAGQFCDIPGSEGVCSTPASNGTKCDKPAQCQSNSCIDGACCSTAVCPPGQFCNSGTCAPPAANGTVCTDGAQCLSTNCVNGVCCNNASCPPGQLCNIPGSEGICALPSAIGAPCTAPAQCSSTFCVNGVCCGTVSCPAGQVCNLMGFEGSCAVQPTLTATATRTITPTPTPSPQPNGASCSNDPQCVSMHCLFNPDNGKSTCCSTATCPDPQRCDVDGFAGTCHDKLANGQVCTNPSDCLSNTCVGGHCSAAPTATPVAKGGQCTSNAQCQLGLFCTEGVCCTSQSCPTGESCRVSGFAGDCHNVPTPPPTPTPTPTGKPNGASCNAATAALCDSGFCTDGFCCEATDCSQVVPGDRCDIFNFEGTCTAPLQQGEACNKNTDCEFVSDQGLFCLDHPPGSLEDLFCDLLPTPTPTLIAFATPTNTQGPLVSNSRSGGCSIGDGSAGGSGIALLLGLPLALWFRRRRLVSGRVTVANPQRRQ